MKNWLKLKLIWDIKVFLSFANFNWYFISCFGRMAGPFIFIFKILLTKFIKYFLISIDLVINNNVSEIENRSIRKIGNKLIKI